MCRSERSLCHRLHSTLTSEQGYIWGRSVDKLLDLLSKDSGDSTGFDVIIMSDLVFNHSQVRDLRRSLPVV